SADTMDIEVAGSDRVKVIGSERLELEGMDEKAVKLMKLSEGLKRTIQKAAMKLGLANKIKGISKDRGIDLEVEKVKLIAAAA
ncbi:MAG: hypothetical protein LBF97_05000, partial [Elusimicrobiota bacterium]|nr:hypothetical protein [Elusimicrobiota bacterium]